MARLVQLDSFKSGMHQGGAPIENKNALITLKGIVIPVNWDNKGNVIAIAISTDREEEYLICNDDKGKGLFKFIQELVKIRGTIEEVAGIKLMKIDNMEKCDLDNPGEVEQPPYSPMQH